MSYLGVPRRRTAICLDPTLDASNRFQASLFQYQEPRTEILTRNPAMAELGRPKTAKKEQEDDSIMGVSDIHISWRYSSANKSSQTNNSSIVSKRSVERLYLPEPHFFRCFVKKPQRRSPLINRGYWLRMHAVEDVVRRFLEEPAQKQKLVINLGSG